MKSILPLLPSVCTVEESKSDAVIWCSFQSAIIVVINFCHLPTCLDLDELLSTIMSGVCSYHQLPVSLE